jgi:hypothetical protein
MALEQRAPGKYITVTGGKFTLRVQEGTPGAVTRINKENKTVHELKYEAFTGKLVGVRVTDGAYGKSWVFDFKDKEDIYHWQSNYSNSFSTAFLRMLPNIDLTKEMTVSPSVKMVDGKNQSSLFVKQGGNVIKHAYNKENPNGLPQMEEITVKGVKQWDDTKRIDFLYNMVVTTILPKLGQASATAPSKAVAESVKEESSNLDKFAESLNSSEESAVADSGF